MYNGLQSEGFHIVKCTKGKIMLNYLVDFKFSCIMSNLLSMPIMIAELVIFLVNILVKITTLNRRRKIKDRVVNVILALASFLLILQVVLNVSQVYHTEKIDGFKDGYVYFGNTVNGKANGKGRMYDKEGNLIYMGEYINNQRDGKGIEYSFSEELDKMIVIYNGGYKEGLRDGYGVFFYIAGTKAGEVKYEGEFYKGKACGSGIYYKEDGTIYEGGFADNQRNGFGVETTVDEEGAEVITKGTYVNGVKNGYIEEYVNGQLSFEGNYVNGVKEGEQGKEYYENGNAKYIGDYRNGKRHGEGILYYENGSEKYKGEFKNGYFHGKGTEYNENGGIIYSGDHQNGIANGKAITMKVHCGMREVLQIIILKAME